MNKFILSISCSVFFAGCASEPIIDERGVDPARYEADLATAAATPSRSIRWGRRQSMAPSAQRSARSLVLCSMMRPPGKARPAVP